MPELVDRAILYLGHIKINKVGLIYPRGTSFGTNSRMSPCPLGNNHTQWSITLIFTLVGAWMMNHHQEVAMYIIQKGNHLVIAQSKTCHPLLSTQIAKTCVLQE